MAAAIGRSVRMPPPRPPPIRVGGRGGGGRAAGARGRGQSNRRGGEGCIDRIVGFILDLFGGGNTEPQRDIALEGGPEGDQPERAAQEEEPVVSIFYL